MGLLHGSINTDLVKIDGRPIKGGNLNEKTAIFTADRHIHRLMYYPCRDFIICAEIRFNELDDGSFYPHWEWVPSRTSPSTYEPGAQQWLGRIHVIQIDFTSDVDNIMDNYSTDSFEEYNDATYNVKYRMAETTGADVLLFAEFFEGSKQILDFSIGISEGERCQVA